MPDTHDWTVERAYDLANTIANHGWTPNANSDLASECIYALCRTLRSLGNAAAMHAALEGIEGDCRVLDRKDMWEEEGECYYDALRDIRDKVSVALAAPARNCDRTKDEAESVFKAKFGRPWTAAEDELATWLFAEDTSFRDAAVKQANKLANELRNLLD